MNSNFSWAEFFFPVKLEFFPCSGQRVSLTGRNPWHVRSPEDAFSQRFPSAPLWVASRRAPIGCCSKSDDIAAEEGFSRERLRQIVGAATAPARGYDGRTTSGMQMARLTPVLRLAADGVARGDAKSIPLFLRPARPLFRAARGFQLAQVVHGTATPAICEARKTGGEENRRRRPRPIRRGASRIPIAERATAWKRSKRQGLAIG